jgi:hypothetical protein
MGEDLGVSGDNFGGRLKTTVTWRRGAHLSASSGKELGTGSAKEGAGP